MATKISLAGQIAEVKRELALRKTVYAQRVRDRKMRAAEAELCIARMEAVLATLLFCQRHEKAIREYIASKPRGAEILGNAEERA